MPTITFKAPSRSFAATRLAFSRSCRRRSRRCITSLLWEYDAASEIMVRMVDYVTDGWIERAPSKRPQPLLFATIEEVCRRHRRRRNRRDAELLHQGISGRFEDEGFAELCGHALLRIADSLHAARLIAGSSVWSIDGGVPLRHWLRANPGLPTLHHGPRDEDRQLVARDALYGYVMPRSAKVRLARAPEPNHPAVLGTAHM